MANIQSRVIRTSLGQMLFFSRALGPHVVPLIGEKSGPALESLSQRRKPKRNHRFKVVLVFPFRIRIGTLDSSLTLSTHRHDPKRERSRKSSATTVKTYFSELVTLQEWKEQYSFNQTNNETKLPSTTEQPLHHLHNLPPTCALELKGRYRSVS